MSALLRSSVPLSRIPQSPRALVPSAPPEQLSPAFASLTTPAWVSGLAMAVVVLIVQLSTRGFDPAFASSFVENWLVMWALAFPVFYLGGAGMKRLLARMAGPVEARRVDLAALVVRGGEEKGFTVARNLKVREGFYRG
ncbi:MAG TPA: hypothetical protein VIG66_11180 [Noviherbaspirillum sp.]